MLVGKCPKCGVYYFGWSLRNPRHQMCGECGTGLEITENGDQVTNGYSPFTAEKYIINKPTRISPSEKQ